jgi:LysM repeat protein
MSDQENAQNIIESYKKRQQRAPFFLGGLAVVLLITGIFVIALYLTGPNRPAIGFLSTDTPTPTLTSTPTEVPPTATPTPTTPVPSETPTPTETISPTPSGPFIYVVQEGDTCSTIAEEFNVEVVALIEINDLPSDCPIFVGDQIVVPPPGALLDTPTPLPDDFFGRIEYRIQEGDSLAGIAFRFNSTVEAILELNEDLENANEIFVGQILIIPVNIATPLPTLPPGAADVTPGTIITLTPASTNTPAP